MSALDRIYADRRRARIDALEAEVIAQQQRAEALERALTDQAARALHFYRRSRDLAKGTRER